MSRKRIGTLVPLLPKYRKVVRHREGDLLEGILLRDSKGDPFPLMARCNRVFVYARAGLTAIMRERREVTGVPADFVMPGQTREVSRQGFWLVLEENVACARYRVLHFDRSGHINVGWVNVDSLESSNQFRKVRNHEVA